MAKAKTKRKVPKFATEDEEANWWDQNRKTASRDFREAGLKGEVGKISAKKLRQRLTART